MVKKAVPIEWFLFSKKISLESSIYLSNIEQVYEYKL